MRHPVYLYIAVSGYMVVAVEVTATICPTQWAQSLGRNWAELEISDTRQHNLTNTSDAITGLDIKTRMTRGRISSGCYFSNVDLFNENADKRQFLK